MRTIVELKINVMFEMLSKAIEQRIAESRYWKLLGYLSMADSLGIITVEEREYIERAAVTCICALF